MPELDILSILLIALALSADCLAVAISGSVSLGNFSLAPILRTAFTFGVFQAAMPALGWLAGRTIVDFIADYDHWIAFILLAAIGGRMIWESFRSADSRGKIDISKGLILLTMAVATSIDALAVGLTFAVLEVNIALACSIIGAVALVVTITGFMLGRKMKALFGKRTELIGGVILIAIGLRVLLTHIL